MNTHLHIQRSQITDIAMPKLSMYAGHTLQRKCACGQHTIAGGECEECRQKREGMLQRAAVNTAPTNGVPSIVHGVLNSSGQPLDAGTRAFMEPRFGHDFSQVRVHTDARAAESAQSVNALAYTVGRNVVFGVGQYAPATSEGKRLMAHELTHVVQQTGTRGNTVNESSDLEREAELASNYVLAGHHVDSLSCARYGTIQFRRGDPTWLALQAWSAGVTMDLEPSPTSLILPPDGVGSLWFHAMSPLAPPSIIRIAIIAFDSAGTPIDSMMTNWFPETGGNSFDEKYRLEIRTTGTITAAIAFTDLDNDWFKRNAWHLTVTASYGPPAYRVPTAEPQPEYIVTGTASTTGAGGKNFFFSGAGHDIESTGYIGGFQRAFAAAGLSNFTDVNVSSGTRATDITSTMALYQGPTQQTIPAATAVTSGVTATSGPVPRGQRNLIGYSFGGAVAASVARELADSGVEVDNLVLIGTPISIQFLRGLQISPKIKRVIVVNLPNDVVRPGTSPSALVSALGPGAASVDPHFFFAEGDVNQVRREQLARLLYSLGLR
jgi:hypothetical protein